MDGLMNFLVNNYLIFLLIALILIFALVGYFVDSKKKKNENQVSDENINEEVKMVEDLKKLEDTRFGDVISKGSAKVEEVPEEIVPTPEVVSNNDILGTIPTAPKMENVVPAPTLEPVTISATPKAESEVVNLETKALEPSEKQFENVPPIQETAPSIPATENVESSDDGLGSLNN